jgi:hypothetical protein
VLRVPKRSPLIYQPHLENEELTSIFSAADLLSQGGAEKGVSAGA